RLRTPSFSDILFFLFSLYVAPRVLHSFPTRRSSDLPFNSGPFCDAPVLLLVFQEAGEQVEGGPQMGNDRNFHCLCHNRFPLGKRSEEHTSELQSRENLVCRLLLEKKNKKKKVRKMNS